MADDSIQEEILLGMARIGLDITSIGYNDYRKEFFVLVEDCSQILSKLYTGISWPTGPVEHSQLLRSGQETQWFVSISQTRKLNWHVALTACWSRRSR